jgi:hypothetical protein
MVARCSADEEKGMPNQAAELGTSVKAVARRTSYLALLFAISCALCACGQRMIDEISIKPLADISQPDTRVDLEKLLLALEVQLEKQGSARKPPITDAELERLAPAMPCPIPTMLEQIYRWHNGMDRLLPGYELLSLDETLKELRGIRQTERTVGVPASLAWPKTYLPILRFDSQEYIALDCARKDGGALLHNMNESSDWDARYRGLGHLLVVTLTAYESGAYRFRRWYLDENPIKLSKAYRQHAIPSELAGYDENWQRLARPLKDGDRYSFQGALAWVPHRPDERYIPILQERLRDADSEVVMHAASMLGTLRAQAAQADLVSVLTSRSDSVRNLAAHALADLDHLDQGHTVDALLKLLEDDSDLVRISAIEALATARSSRAVGPLLELLPTSRPGIQQSIVSTLGELRDPKALDALRDLRLKVAAMDLDKPDRGGTRGSDPPPSRLLAGIDEAIRAIGG